MPEDPTNPTNLSIRCPDCHQRFDVGSELKDRMVECGNCDSKFRIDEQVISRPKKMYPGERNAPMLDRFQRVPRSSVQQSTDTQNLHYEEFNNLGQASPASPQRILAGFVGAILIALTALILIFAANPNASFYSMALVNKIIITSFVSVLSTILLLYANPNGKRKTLFISLLLSAGLIGMPFFLKGGNQIADVPRSNIEGSNNSVFPEAEIDTTQNLHEEFGIGPLIEAQENLDVVGNGQNAFGVYLTNIIGRNKYTARDFLIRETEADLSSHPFPRDAGAYLMVLTGLSKSFEEITQIASKLGTVEKTHPEIGVIVIKVENEQFEAGSAEKVNNPNDPAFYELNIRELNSIDIDRVEQAVKRIVSAPPAIYRKDITKILSDLLAKPRLTFQLDISRALLKWTENPEESSKIAIEAIKQNILNETVSPEALVKLAVLSKSPEAIEPVHTIWMKSPNLLDKYLVQLGPKTVPYLLRQLTSKEAPLQRSAIKLLGSVAGRESLPPLTAILKSKDPEIRMLAKRAIAEINAR